MRMGSNELTYNEMIARRAVRVADRADRRRAWIVSVVIAVGVILIAGFVIANLSGCESEGQWGRWPEDIPPSDDSSGEG